MTSLEKVLSGSEKAVYSLRSLYVGYGYQQYKMSKFEEYDLYARNKGYLVSDAVITFTDTDGKLLALKPDVTLSIIKNGKDQPETLKKVCYGENVYRPSKGTHSFKEIMQVGLECQGDIDAYVINEVLTLALLSLKSISNDYALDLSHLGIVSSVIEDLGVSDKVAKQVLELLGEKNVFAIEELLKDCGVKENKISTMVALSTAYGNAKEVLKKLYELDLPLKAKESLEQLASTLSALERLDGYDKINVDFSVVNNMNYYNGIVFKGFISGIPTGILSGGQYDNLMQKMGKKSGAIGFAVYLDELEKLSEEIKYDVDVVVLYDKDTKIEDVNKQVDKVILGGETVLATKNSPEKLRYKRLIKV